MDLTRFLGKDGMLPDFDMLQCMASSREVRKLMYFLELCKVPHFVMLSGARPARHLAEAYRPDGVP
jgi:hypothetical protein